MERGERREPRIEAESYQFIEFSYKEDPSQKISTLIINSSSEGFCCLYIGLDAFSEGTLLVDNKGQTYEIVWVNKPLGQSKSIGLHLKKEAPLHVIDKIYEYLDPKPQEWEDKVEAVLSQFKNNLDRSLILHLHYIEGDYERLKAMRFHSGNIIFFKGNMKDVLPWINNMTNKFALINIDAVNWEDYLANVLRFFLKKDPKEFEHCERHRSSNQRPQILSAVSDKYPNLSARDYTKIETILEEMLMNGFYDAPTDNRGINIFASYDRKIDVTLSKEEALTLCHGKHDKLLWLKIRDVFGSFPPAIFLRYLKKCIRGGKQAIDSKPGGAGLGLYMMWRNSHSLFLRVSQGRSTEFISSVDVGLKKSKLSSTICLAQSID